MKVAVPQETFPGERRVALAPANVAPLRKAGYEVFMERGAGEAAGFRDEAYTQHGATVVESREQLIREGDLIVQVRGLGMNPTAGLRDVPWLHTGQFLLGMWDPLGSPQHVQQVASSGVGCFSLELIPRITRAQSMDVLSSMATIAGYRAVLLAALELPKIFPLMMTAAGTLTAARVFVIGAGVAGLQAIATAKRLGAVVHAYDVRPACREQVESVGGKFVELPLETGEAEDRGGYAKALGDEFYRRQRELLANIVAENDVVITTAAIPGKPSPLLVTADAVRRMAPGSVIVDLAAERGGNCELSQPDQRVVEQGVAILGPTNLPGEAPRDASLMFGNNVTKFLLNLMKQRQWQLNLDDEIIRETLMTRDGEVIHPRIRDLLGLGPLAPVVPEEPPEPAAPPGSGDAPIPFDSDPDVAQRSSPPSSTPDNPPTSPEGN
jgi:H+-translocating NAD(P) transhydrogenase subunit alpha